MHKNVWRHWKRSNLRWTRRECVFPSLDFFAGGDRVDFVSANNRTGFLEMEELQFDVVHCFGYCERIIIDSVCTAEVVICFLETLEELTTTGDVGYVYVDKLSDGAKGVESVGVDNEEHVLLGSRWNERIWLVRCVGVWVRWGRVG